MSTYLPPSVRHGNRRAKLGWWLKGRREALALRLAPWLNGNAQRTAIDVDEFAKVQASRAFANLTRRADDRVRSIVWRGVCPVHGPCANTEPGCPTCGPTTGTPKRGSTTDAA